jgi:hypothetical protein
MKMAVLWVAAPYRLVDVYQRFRGTCCRHHLGDIALIMSLYYFCTLLLHCYFTSF